MAGYCLHATTFMALTGKLSAANVQNRSLTLLKLCLKQILCDDGRRFLNAIFADFGPDGPDAVPSCGGSRGFAQLFWGHVLTSPFYSIDT